VSHWGTSIFSSILIVLRHMSSFSRSGEVQTTTLLSPTLCTNFWVTLPRVWVKIKLLYRKMEVQSVQVNIYLGRIGGGGKTPTRTFEPEPSATSRYRRCCVSELRRVAGQAATRLGTGRDVRAAGPHDLPCTKRVSGGAMPLYQRNTGAPDDSANNAISAHVFFLPSRRVQKMLGRGCLAQSRGDSRAMQ